ncbi:sugar ABC transporter substrate-binding protein [Conexibacter sp. JD483]|uniref:sugar ABC transporter substrate-binding protein n=1 Tax=unclassified Conexibacter TaxID=2627773 RepID=UPI00271E53DF|nr:MULTISPECIES: sugar ABC transporter substrate-binding protein [unclassified Conexibacter]MDO8188697.1 sugar ABC transporter substrate-binding protein [Conexibacter sp. CPCC 205706]MDO8201563.1 sugar ABC transporter substrate-binding protein [Conexibacter sp. CPCC 205762]MDR9371654.1 sugar ABC transporter substrate-binding protein [Conexibacter sp. JD483]
MFGRSLRRLTALTLAAAATAALGAGCGSSSDDDGGSGTSAASGGGGGDKPVVGFINGSSVEFNMCVSRGLKAGLGDAAELNEVNSRDDVGAEVSNGEDLLARKPDALVLQTVNVQSGAQIVDKANGDDVPVFLSSVDFVRDPSKVAGAVVFDNGATGAKIGGFLAEQVRAAGGSGEVKVGIVAGAPGAASDFLVRGFKGALAAAPNAKVVFEQPGMWNRGKAASVAENMIQAQPDLDYVLVSNEDMAFGVLKSLQAAGKDGQVKILTNGGTELGLRAVEDGEFLSTTDASPFQIGFRTGRAVLDQLDGRSAAEPVQTLPVQVITRDNAAGAAAYCAAS